MFKKKILFILISLFLVCNINGQIAANQQINIDNEMFVKMDIQDLIQKYIDENEGVGAAVGLIDHGRIQFFSYGKKSINEDDVISEDTIFEIGSITKTLTTLVLMDLVNKGEVKLDDPIEIYLNGITVPKLWGKKITLRHLATHTSGIPRMPDNFNPKNPNNPYENYNVKNLYDYLNNCTLGRKPGKSFEYSNIGVGLLGHILSVKSGKSYEELITSLISEKLGMSNTSISLTDEMKLNFADGHHLGQKVEHWDFTALAGAGAIRSNIRDMTQFLAANMGIFRSELTDIMKECHQKQYAQTPAFEVGLGWLITKSNNATLIWHNGGTGGFRSFIGFNPKTERGIVVLTNSTEDWPDELGNLVLDPDYKQPIIDRTLANNQDYLNNFVGSYKVSFLKGLLKKDLQISVEGKLLACSFLSETSMLYPEAFGVFGIKGFPNGKLHFSFDEQGNVIKGEMILNGKIAFEAIKD